MFVVWVRGIYIISITKGAGRRSTRRHPEISKKKLRRNMNPENDIGECGFWGDKVHMCPKINMAL